ncbi:hypothetical protein PVAP13_6NG068060 [Panicum virgatum]|uniref:Uncharacterized protein n=1 Tax=Panicum virgatum TaxID=38727 RepID=A0A8T0QVD0_PANVG|nr:hypothetical protein PVAP13_6NG068060 [Panicum virgatum]
MMTNKIRSQEERAAVVGARRRLRWHTVALATGTWRRASRRSHHACGRLILRDGPIRAIAPARRPEYPSVALWCGTCSARVRSPPNRSPNLLFSRRLIVPAGGATTPLLTQPGPASPPPRSPLPAPPTPATTTCSSARHGSLLRDPCRRRRASAAPAAVVLSPRRLPQPPRQAPIASDRVHRAWSPAASKPAARPASFFGARSAID